MTSSPTFSETLAIHLALRGDAPWARALRAQIPALKVSKRALFDSGFVTDFETPDDVEPIEMVSDREVIDGWPPSVNAEVRGVSGTLVTFVVWVGADGFITQLDASLLSDGSIPKGPWLDYENFKNDDLSLLPIPIVDEARRRSSESPVN